MTTQTIPLKGDTTTMALLTSGSVEPQRNPQATAAAAAVYGQANGNRMNREAGIAAVAAAHTSTPPASYADGSFDLGQPTKLGGVKDLGNVSVTPSKTYPNT
jgi:hypothetical protein